MKNILRNIAVLLFTVAATNGFAQKTGLAAVDSIKNDLHKIKNIDTGYTKQVYRIADRYKNINSDSAMHYAQYGLKLAKQQRFKKAIAALYDCIGNLYSNNGSYIKALSYYNESLLINREIGNLRNETANLLNIGSVYQRQGNDAKALEYSFKALKIAEKENYDNLKAILLSNIADSYFMHKDLRMSLSYNVKSYRAYKKLNDMGGIAGAADAIGNIYLEQKNYKIAELYYKESLSTYKSLDDKLNEAIVMSHLALVYENDKPKKIKYLMDAQALFDEINPLYPNSITNLGNIGGTYADLYVNKALPKKLQKHMPANYNALAMEAEKFFDIALAASQQVGDNDNFSYFKDELSQLQESKGDYRNALKNLRLSKSISDSLYSQESKNKIANLQAQYTFEKKEDAYKQKQQLADLRMKQVYLYAALAILLISSILIYYLNQSRINQLRLKNELQRQQAEVQTKELIHKNKLSESELKAIRAQMNPHFIFNVLNSIESYIVENDAKTASKLVQKFASLSRLVLENSTQSLVVAEREWKALKLYTELEAMRFNHLFNYSFEVDENLNMANIILPPMLVQPLIENSIHHGMRNSTSETKIIKVSLTQTANSITFVVDDTGIGYDEKAKSKTFSAVKSKSIGLSSITDRIESFNVLHANEMATFSIRRKTQAEGEGTIAVLVLPKIYRTV